jgi:hypothetical protein
MMIPEVEDRTEASLSKVAASFKVILFGAGKTMFAPPDQPALQILLQYRNLYELALRNLQRYALADNTDPIPHAAFAEPTALLDKMWQIVHQCMVEYNRSVQAHAKLLSAERVVVLNRTPVLPSTIPNPGYSRVPDKPATSNSPDSSSTPDPAEPIVLDPDPCQ